jgi:hypothetical protein
MTSPEKPAPKEKGEPRPYKVNANRGQEIEVIKSPGNNEEYHVFEQVEGPDGKIGYAEFDNADNEVRFIESFMDLEETKRYEPLDPVLWPLAEMSARRMAVDYPTEAIYDEIREYIYAHLDLPDDRLYDVLSAWAMATWIPEKFETVPYLFFMGTRDSGKTRGLETLHQLSYRGILSPSASPSALFRHIEKYGPTLFLDEAEIYGLEEKREAIALLNAGYRRGQYVLRTSTETSEGQAFAVFGFKALASTDILTPTLESRAIVIPMNRNVRNVKLLLDKEEAKQLRMKLLLYRFRMLRTPEGIEGFEGFSEVSPLGFGNGRIVELFYPLVSVTNKGREAILEYAKENYQARLEEEQTTIEAQLVQAVLACENDVEQGKISTARITEKFNENKPEREQWKVQSVGYALKKLGFKSCRMPSGNFGKYWDASLIERLKKRYPPLTDTSQKPSNPSDPSTLEAPRKICDVCGKQPGRLHLIPGEGERWLCDNCARDYLGPL